MVSYSPRAAPALGHLKRTVNDVDIYVEDTANPNMWCQIIRKLLPSSTRFQSVNVLGGRDKVIAACRRDQRADGRRKLYIIDGDLGHLQGKKCQNLKFLYRLKCYCVENILLHEAAFKKIGTESIATLPEDKVLETLEFESIINLCESLLRPLFIAYAACNEIASEIETVGYNINKMIKRTKGSFVLSRSLLFERLKSLIKAVKQAGLIANFNEKFRAIRARLLRISSLKFISGKDYLMPLFHEYVKRKLFYRGTIEQFKVRLANEYEPRMEPWFSRRVARL